MRGVVMPYSPPDFCWFCGKSFPWASRAAIVYALQNLLDEQPDMDSGDRRLVEEQLNSLLESPSDAAADKRQQRAVEAFKRLAPAVWEKGLPIAAALLTAEAKRQLGLPV
jgi:hypothetical protein